MAGQSSAPTPTLGKAAGAVVQQQPVPESPVISMKKTVVFLESDCLRIGPDGSRSVQLYLGTAFLITHHDERYPSIGGFNYLVTNRHVAQPGIEDGQACQIVDYKIRFNLKNPGPNGALSDAFSVGATLPWAFSADESVDLAVIPFGADPARFNFLTIPTSIFLSQEEAEKQHVVEGDSVLFTGLFVQFLGQLKLEPIVREGRIAMIPDEPVPTTLRKMGKAYLVDSHVFGGNSGSPIFINLGGQRADTLITGYNYKLLGVVSGYIQETSELQLQPVASYAGTVAANSGIAVVVPAQCLLDLLETPMLRSQRDMFAVHFPKQQPVSTVQKQ